MDNVLEDADVQLLSDLLMEDDLEEIPSIARTDETSENDHFRMIMAKVAKVIESGSQSDSSSTPATLSTVSSPSSSISSKQEQQRHSGRMRSRKQYSRRKDELIYLRDRVSELESELVVLQKNKRELTLGNVWKVEAEKETCKRQKSEQENNALKTSIQDQLNVAHKLQEYFVTTSMQQLFTHKYSERAQFRLSNIETERVVIIQNIVETDFQRVYGQLRSIPELMQTTRDVPYMGVTTHYEGSVVEIQVNRMMRFPNVTPQDISVALWNLIHFQFHRFMFMDDLANSSILDQIDENTFYTRYQCHMGFTTDVTVPTLESYSICKRHEESKDLMFITWRCILEDDLFPTTAGAARHDENGLIVLESGTTPTGEPCTIAKMTGFVRPPVDSLNMPTGMFTESLLGAVHNHTYVAINLLNEITTSLRCGA